MRYDGCSKKLIEEQSAYRLYHYHCPNPQFEAPLLVVFSLINTPWVLDLHPQRSMIQAWLAQGIDVYLLEWKKPQQPVEDLQQAVKATCVSANVDALHLLGICQGGYFSLGLCALYPEQIKTVIPMVTPIDFAIPNHHLCQLIQQMDFKTLISETESIISGRLIDLWLTSLDPARAWESRYKAWQACQYDPIKQQIFFALEAWKQECPDQDKLLFLEFVEQEMKENRLINSGDLSKVTAPILNVYATHDYLWPAESTTALAQQHKSLEYQEYAFAGGHIGVLMSERALQEIPTLIKNWIKKSDAPACKRIAKS